MILYKTINSMALSESTNVSNPYEILQEGKDGYLDDISSIHFEILTEGAMNNKMEIVRKSLAALKKFIRDMIEKMKAFVNDLIGKISGKKKSSGADKNKMVDWVDYEFDNAITPKYIVKTLGSDILGDYLYVYDEIKKSDFGTIIPKINDRIQNKLIGPYKDSQTKDFKKICHSSFRKGDSKLIKATDSLINEYKNFDGPKFLRDIVNAFDKMTGIINREIDDTNNEAGKLYSDGKGDTTETYKLFIHTEVLKNITSLVMASSTEHLAAAKEHIKQVEKIKYMR